MTEFNLIKDIVIYLNGIGTGMIITIAVAGFYNLRQIRKNLKKSEKLLSELQGLKDETEI